MPKSEVKGDGSPGKSDKTLSDLLFYFRVPSLRDELERFRLRWETKFGKVALDRRYTSTWPEDQQQWLLDNYPDRYWEGLPVFVQAFIKEKMKSAHREGILDDMPPSFLRLYLSGQMRVAEGGPRRG